MNDVEALLGLSPLKIGQRVRVRLSGECDFGHHEFCNRVLGEVRAIFPDPWPEHPYYVALNCPGWTGGGSFARAELERL